MSIHGHLGVTIIGHRGSGCTDSPFAQSRNKAEKRIIPAENTLSSFKLAFDRGADAVEYDVVEAAGRLLVVHNVVLSDHVFSPAPLPAKHLTDLCYEEIRDLRTGIDGDGEIPTFAAVLALTQKNAPSTASIGQNIEIKGTKGSGLPEDLGFVERIVDSFNASGHPPERTVFSSFGLGEIIKFNALMPKARIGMLFETRAKPESSICPHRRQDSENRYLHFTESNLGFVLERASIKYVHPEISSVTKHMAEMAAENGLGINTWAWEESNPLTDPESHDNICNAVRICEANDVKLGIITDFVPEMRAVVRDCLNYPSPHL
jgi:glycerophosphoryl diester phosphodiesterase